MKQNNKTEKLSQHEDTALKVVSEFFRDEILPALQIEGKVVGSMATEDIHLELKKGYEDFNFLMEDDSVKHFEFQSTNEGKRGLKRFRMYEAHMSYHHNKEVTTYVMFSGNIKNPMTEFTEGINTYRVHGIILQGRNADEIIQKLKNMSEAGIPLTKADLLPLVLCPLMGGQMSQKDRIVAAYDITRNALGVDQEVIRKVEAVIYIMADKFLETAEMEEWLKTYPNIQIVSRDGALTYSSAISQSHPNAIQVSDRFHLIKSLSEAIQKYIVREFPSRIEIP